MISSEYDLDKFVDDPTYFGRFEMLITVKSFDLQAIRKRYLRSRKRSRTGSVERRNPAIGGLVYVEVENGEIIRQEVLARILEARGVALYNQQLAVSSENTLYILREGENSPHIVENDWFSYIHTVRWNEKNNRLLLASSGVDTIMELESDTWNVVWEWFAWEHGFDEGENPETHEPHILTRSSSKAESFEEQGENVLLVNNPRENPIPTAMRAAFINSAEYDQHGNIIATLFHHGKVLRINRKTLDFEELFTGLTKPHGGMQCPNGYLVTDTAGGRVVIQKDQSVTNYNFHDLPGKNEELEHLEWLQTSHYTENTIVTIDSNRNAFVSFDPIQKVKMVTHFDPNWAVQDFVFIPPGEYKFIKHAGSLLRQSLEK